MVDAEKARRPKGNKNKNTNLPDIDLKSLIFGAAAYAFFPLMAYQQSLDILMAFAAIGPLYIGYQAKTSLKATLLGIVGATPLLYLAFAGLLGSYGATEIADIIITITILGLGAIMAFLGAYLLVLISTETEQELRKNTKLKITLKEPRMFQSKNQDLKN